MLFNRRRLFNRGLLGGAGLLGFWAAPILAGSPDSGRAQRIVVHVGGDSESEMNVALSNITNAEEYHAARGSTVSIELVANGPGYAMLREDVSPVKERIAEVHKRFPSVVFAACQFSRRAVAKAQNKSVDEIRQVPEATDVSAGIVEIAELQALGWSYIRA